MEKKEELRRLLREAARTLGPGPAGHLSEDELIDYQERRLDESARQRVQWHMADCRECLELFRTVDRFLRPPAGGEAVTTPEQTAEAWESFRRRTRPETASPVAVTPAGPRRSAPPWLKPGLAVAAALVLVTLPFGIYTTRLRTELKARAADARALEAARTEVQTLTRKQKEDRDEIGRLTQLLNVRGPLRPVREVTLSFTQTRGEETEPTLEPPAAVGALVIHIRTNKATGFPAYDLVITDAHGRERLTVAAVKQDEHQNLNVQLEMEWLPSGRYTLKLFGVTPGGTRPRLAEYAFRVKAPRPS